MHVSPILYFDLETQLSAADVGRLGKRRKHARLGRLCV